MRFGLVFSVLSVVACGETAVKTVNATPEAYITSHATGDTVDDATTETIRGQVADSDHALSELNTAWLYNGDPVCPDSAPDDAGAVSCDVTFTTDGGDVTLTVRDPDGETATARVSLDVQETDAPRAELTSPVADGVYYSDQTIAFQGTVSDTEDDPEDLTVTFETDALGDLGLDITVTSEGEVEAFGMLDEGEHAVRLAVTDTSGKQSIDSALINVGPPNSAPTCAITAPTDGSAGAEGDDVRLEGTASDVDVASNLLTASWASDKDGPLGESTPDTDGSVGLAISDLTANTHRITLTVTDELGAPCATSIYYTVGTPPVLNVTAPADGATLNHSDAVVFEATVTDNEDLPNEVALSWESDIDGVFSTDGADSSGAATVSIATLSAGDHVVTVTATDTDGLFVTDTVSFNLNAPPTTPTVTLEPDPAATNQMLVATASGSEDPEGTGTVTYAYAWFEDGVASAESASATFPASATGKNHTYRVQVTASDGLVDSAFGYAEVNVINSDPVLSGPTLSAATATVGDVLTCTASATDIDPEDSPTVTYAWSDGSTGPTYTITMADAVDSTITCTATADDADGGVVTGTASATVTNTAPTVDTVTVTPAEASVGDVLTCAATASDADGDTPTITYAWSDASTGTTFTVPDTAVTGDVITCTATATDERGVTGSATASATVTNSAPTITAVTIGPAPAYNTDTLVCTVTATDPDGDTPTIAYEWTGGATGPELPLTSIIAAPYDSFTCTATATDGDLSSAPVSETVTIANRDPMATATISPASPTKHSTLTCTASGVSDADDDATTVAFGWTINDAPAIAATTDDESILSDSIDRGDTVVCTVTVTDSSGGSTTRTASATIGNTAPVVSDVTLSPSDVYTNDVITASATITDAEESADELDVTYRFFVGVDMVQEGSSNTLDGTVHFDKGDSVYVAVKADDGLVTHTESSDTLTVLNTPPTAPEISIASTVSSDGVFLSAGHSHSCAINQSDEAVCWGWNAHGQSSPVDGTFDQIHGGSQHTCALGREGEVSCWGSDTHSQISGTPDGIWADLSVGSYHSCVLDDEGSMTCWGWNSYGQANAPDGSFVKVSGGDRHSCAIDTAGAIHCWGDETSGKTDAPDGTFTEVRATSWHTCGLTTEGTITCWGSDDRGGVSDAPSGYFRSLDNGWGHASCAIDLGGNIACWGYGDFGVVAGVPSDGPYRSVTVGADHACADNGEYVECWGRNNQGQINVPDSLELATASAELTCTIDEESTDADGDPITYTFDWDVDGEEYMPVFVPPGGLHDGDTVSADALGYSEVWTCEVTPTDGEADGEIGSAEYENLCYGTESSCPAASCKAILDAGYSEGSGTYWLDPDEDGTGSFEAYCEMSATYEDGGWTLVSVHSDDDDHNWTYDNRTYMTTSDVTFGSIAARNLDYRSLAFIEVAMNELLFIHQPSGIWAEYNTDTSRMSIGAFIDSFGGLVDYSSSSGLPMEAGTLTEGGDMCSTDLYINPSDGDGSPFSPRGDHAWGPAWSTEYNHGCPLDDPGVRGGLGPVVSGPSFEWNPEEGPPGRSVGFGYSLGVNTGAAGAGENYMQVYVR